MIKRCVGLSCSILSPFLVFCPPRLLKKRVYAGPPHSALRKKTLGGGIRIDEDFLRLAKHPGRTQQLSHHLLLIDSVPSDSFFTRRSSTPHIIFKKAWRAEQIPNARSSIGVIHKKGFTIRSSRPCGGAAAWFPAEAGGAALNGERASRRVEAWLRREM